MYDNINNFNVMYTSTNSSRTQQYVYCINKVSIDDIGEICTIQTTNLN